MDKVEPRVVREAVRQDEAEGVIKGLAPEVRARQVEMAKAFATVDSTCHWAYRGCSKVEQYGEQLGFSAREARALAKAGRAFAHCPELEERVLACRISLEAAAALEPLLADPALVRENEDWLVYAEGWTLKRLETEVRKRQREAKEREPVSSTTVVLTDSERELFARARAVASRKMKRPLDAGEVVGILADHYLDSFDPERREPGTRRMPSTEVWPGRSIPEGVRRIVKKRQKGRCCVPGCDNTIFMEFAHLVPHSEGGCRETFNLIYVCRCHHKMLDHGFLTFEGTAADPKFRDADGNRIEGEPRAPP